MRTGLLIFVLALAGCDSVVSTDPYTVDAVVIATHYVPSNSSLGVGFTSGGNMAITPVSSSASYALTIQLQDGSRDLVELDKARFLQFAVGDTYRIPCERTRRESGETSERCDLRRGARF